MLEQSEDALQREWREELNTDINVGRLVWVVENFFKEGDRDFHEVGMYYMINLPANSSLLNFKEYTCTDGPVTLRFRWFPLSDIVRLEIHPLFLKKGLLHIPECTEHVIWNDH